MRVFGKSFDYRHIICIAITLGFLALGVFEFFGAVGRVIEGGRDVGLSAGFYFCELFQIPHNITLTVNDFPKVPFFDFLGGTEAPEMPIPEDWKAFTEKWSLYWQTWTTKENFFAYLAFLGNLLYFLSMFVLCFLPVIVVVYFFLRKLAGAENNDWAKDTKPLRVLIIAYYLYFVVSFDLSTLYRQFYKLLYDLWTAISFIPLWGWVFLALFLIDRMRRKRGYSVLHHNEMKNRGFINARPIVLMVCGTMGKKKTTAITDMALSQEVMFRDKAFEKILETDLKFPYFPWISLERTIAAAMRRHNVYNLATCRKFVKHLAGCFYAAHDRPEHAKAIRRHLRKRYELKYDDLCFGYDYERYGFTYNDKLKIVNVWEVLETYAQLYFIYIIQSSLILSNYSIRTDNAMSDIGNFPLWDTDFFKRDSRLQEVYSRHAHILDFDSLRLGKKVIENNPFADSFEFGVVNLTEVGKERKNALELQGIKKMEESANQKNDGFNDWLKMIRHSATVDNFPFVKVITDEQRPESWGADARDLCEIVHIRESGETRLAMPFFFIAELLYSFLFGRFVNLYSKYRYTRGDNTLSMYILKTVAAKIQHYYSGIYNTFGYCTLKVQIESGTQDGQLDENKYYLSNKKIYSKRFSTDCFSDFFTKKALRSPVGIDDLQEYGTEKATFGEMGLQHSYFISGMENKDGKGTD